MYKQTITIDTPITFTKEIVTVDKFVRKQRRKKKRIKLTANSAKYHKKDVATWYVPKKIG
jgi:hypothetical protein